MSHTSRGVGGGVRVGIGFVEADTHSAYMVDEYQFRTLILTLKKLTEERTKASGVSESIVKGD